jgi:hypothetical protein
VGLNSYLSGFVPIVGWSRSRADQEPSRYALRVGEIDVLVVSDGVLSLPGAMLGHDADPAVRAAWLKDMFLPPDVLEWALNVVVVLGRPLISLSAGRRVLWQEPTVKLQ